MRLLSVLALLPFATACNAGWDNSGTKVGATGSGSSRSFAASGFTGVALKGSDDIDVRAGSSFSVVAEGDPKALDQLDIRLDGKTLKVSRKSRSGWLGGDDRGVKIHVVMPKLTNATVAGSGTMRVERAEGAFDGAVAGSGDLDIAALSANKASLSIAGSGNITVAGRAESLDVSVAGSGDMRGENLTAGTADISIAGSGNVRANVPGAASIAIMGSGDVELRGGAKCEVSKMGSGEAKCS